MMEEFVGESEGRSGGGGGEISAEDGETAAGEELGEAITLIFPGKKMH